jgi:hypothetical protein
MSVFNCTEVGGDDIELEEAAPVDGSFLDVSLVEEVN